MFINSSRKRFPNLTRFVDVRSSQHNDEPIVATSAWAFGVMLLVFAAILAVMKAVAWAAFPALLGVLLCFWGYRLANKPETPDEHLAKEARAASHQIAEVLKRGRSQLAPHEAAFVLMEEAARYWSCVNLALRSAFWSSPHLPSHYQRVRDQARWAADRGMDEILVLFGPQLQASPKSGGVGEFVEDLLDSYVFKPPVSPSHLPVGYDTARDIAEKIRGLADQVEVLTREVSQDPSVATTFNAGTALEVCISEIQSINQAESELRQNLNG